MWRSWHKPVIWHWNWRFFCVCVIVFKTTKANSSSLLPSTQVLRMMFCIWHNSSFVSWLLTFPGRLSLPCFVLSLITCQWLVYWISEEKRFGCKKKKKKIFFQEVFLAWQVCRVLHFCKEACFSFISEDKPLWQQFCVVIDVIPPTFTNTLSHTHRHTHPNTHTNTQTVW